MDGLFRRIEPGEKAPPPPAWVTEWATQAVGGVCGGLAWGGWRGLLLAREAGISKTPKQTASHYFAQGALWGGKRVGIFAATFSGIALVTEYFRDKRDTANYAGAGAASAVLFTHRAGFALSAPLVAAATVFGGALGGLQIELERRAGGKLFENVIEAAPEIFVAREDVLAVVSNMESQLAISSAVAQQEAGKEDSKQ